ncbi:MAG: PIN domain-containing protein [Balneolaceae bacterium]|nr:MAG: PIN domain-containing protein [Balneolaceae bacterium]
MTILYDTSALMALFVSKHPNHKAAIDFFLDAKKKNSNFYICTHTIAEFYRNLTSGRKYLTYSPAMAHRLITESLVKFFTPVSLDHKDYYAVVDRMKSASLHGAIIYDGLIARASSKINADFIVTYNLEDFQRVWQLTSSKLVEP